MAPQKKKKKKKATFPLDILLFTEVFKYNQHPPKKIL